MLSIKCQPLFGQCAMRRQAAAPFKTIRIVPGVIVRAALDSPVSVSQANANSNGHAAVSVPAAAPAAPAATPALLAPQAIYETIAALGAKKAALPAGKTFFMGILAGIYIGFGAMLAFSVLTNIPGILSTNPGLAKLISAAVFPLGLSIITLLGAELYTGNTAALPVAIFEGKASFGDLVKNWFFSYAGNFVGSLLMAALVYSTGVFNGTSVVPNLAVAKTSLPLGTALARSVVCNWLVCIAVWIAASASTLPGKLMGLWLPITAFVAVGLEHSVANMFIIPLGMLLGAPVTFSDFIFRNVIPVTIGNTIAGTLLMATSYAYVFGSLGKPKTTPAPAATA